MLTFDRDYLQAKLLYYVRKNMVFALLVGLAVIVMSVPSLLSMFYLALLFIGLISPHHLFTKVLPVAYLYSVLYLAIQFTFNMPCFMEFFVSPDMKNIMYKVGLRSDNNKSFIILGQMLLSLFMALTMRARSILRKEQQEQMLNSAPASPTKEHTPLLEASPQQNNDHDDVASDVPSASEEIDTEDELSDVEEVDPLEANLELDKIPVVRQKSLWKAFQKQLKKLWKSTKEIIMNLIRFMVNFFVRYSYNLSLVVLYFADLFLPNADILHAIYRKFYFDLFINQ